MNCNWLDTSMHSRWLTTLLVTVLSES